MNLVKIYECLCDVTRLRILSLLTRGDLCVCHIQEVMGEPQVKISKHLAYLRARGLVSSRKRGNWMIYGLAARQSAEMKANLACLQDCAREHRVFRADAGRLTRLGPASAGAALECCPPSRRKPTSARQSIR